MNQKLIKSDKIKGKSEINPLRGPEEKKGVLKNPNVVARREARQIIREAEEFAEKIKNETLIDAQKEKKRAFEKGTENALVELEENLLRAREIREKIYQETERDLLKLSVKLAEKIVGREINEDQTVIVDIVTSALQNARQQEKITLRVNPSDLPLVQKKAEDFKNFSQTKYLDFVADPRVSRGGCLIESEVGTVDARLETQLRVLERALLAQAAGQFKKEF